MGSQMPRASWQNEHLFILPKGTANVLQLVRTAYQCNGHYNILLRFVARIYIYICKRVLGQEYFHPLIALIVSALLEQRLPPPSAYTSHQTVYGS
jgi:hypothetical protein